MNVVRLRSLEIVTGALEKPWCPIEGAAVMVMVWKKYEAPNMVKILTKTCAEWTKIIDVKNEWIRTSLDDM